MVNKSWSVVEKTEGTKERFFVDRLRARKVCEDTSGRHLWGGFLWPQAAGDMRVSNAAPPGAKQGQQPAQPQVQMPHDLCDVRLHAFRLIAGHERNRCIHGH